MYKTKLFRGAFFRNWKLTGRVKYLHYKELPTEVLFEIEYDRKKTVSGIFRIKMLTVKDTMWKTEDAFYFDEIPTEIIVEC